MNPIKIHQKIQKWEHWTDSACVHAMIFLLTEAKQRVTTYKGVKIKRGQVVAAGRGAVARGTGMKEGIARGAINRMLRSDDITYKVHKTETGESFTVITITHFEDYQQDVVPVVARKKPEQSEESKIRRASPFREPSIAEVKDYFIERDKVADTDAEASSFYDFYSSKGWMVGLNKMKCWKSAIRNWERRAELKPTTGTKRIHKYTERDRMRDWVSQSPKFRDWHGISITEYSTQVARDLVDFSDDDFWKKYGVTKSTAREVKDSY